LKSFGLTDLYLKLCKDYFDTEDFYVDSDTIKSINTGNIKCPVKFGGSADDIEIKYNMYCKRIQEESTLFILYNRTIDSFCSRRLFNRHDDFTKLYVTGK
jgi:DNA-directed RNA polymerase subunit N (RpoN/RPB10)